MVRLNLSFLSVAIATALAQAAAIPGQIIFDGRIPQSFLLTDFDSASTSKYNPQFVLGAGTKWSQVIHYPPNEASLFDKSVNAKAFEVTINDKSIFAPNPKSPQLGFRRSELLPGSNNGTDATVQQITTHYFSLKASASRPLNISHEYQLVFIETNDFSSHVWTIKLGTPFGSKPAPSSNANMLRLESSTAGGASGDILFQVPWTSGSIDTWHNFGIRTDWDKSELTAFYSSGSSPLKQVVAPRPNDSKGKGQAHFGIVKLPTDSTNPSSNGFQESHLNEGVIYGGIFVEKGAKVSYGCPRRRST